MSENTKKITVVDVASDIDSEVTLYVEDNGVFRRARKDQVKKVLGINDIEENMDNLKNDMVSEDVLFDVMHNTPRAETVEQFFNLRRNGKIYRTRFYMFATNPISAGTKLLDNEGLVCEPSTDTTEGRDDYLNGDHTLFEWYNCNYKRNADGTAYPTAIEGEDGYKTSGNVDVGVIQPSFYYNVEPHTDEGYFDVTISDSPHLLRTDVVLHPWTECVKSDKSVLSWCIGSKYISSLGIDGLLRSLKNGKPENFQSHNNMLTNYQKKGTGYLGAGAERNTFQILFTLIKYATKNSQSVYQGCANYNYQYTASIERTENATYFPLTNTQAANIIVGSTVSVGYGWMQDGKLSNDRGNGNMHKYANKVKVLRIETLDSNNKAVYLDIDTGFPTAKVTVSEGIVSSVYLSTMPWHSGTTDTVIGKHDGSMVSNTNGKYPYRVQGREYGIGAYTIASDTVMFFNSDYSKDVYVAPRGVKHTTNETTIKNTYTKIGNIPASADGKGADYWIGDIGIDINTGTWYPSAIGSGSSQGFADMLYCGGANTSGSREYAMSGGLRSGSVAGFASLSCGVGLSWAGWYYCAAD